MKTLATPGLLSEACDVAGVKIGYSS